MASISLKYKSKSGNLTAPGDVDPGAMIPIATTTLSTSQSTITFSSIPQNYEHLQIRGILKNSGGGTYIKMQLNGDTGSNYSGHELSGNGTAAEALGYSNRTDIPITPNGNTATNFAGFILDVLDYANTNKYKTTRLLMGYDDNGSGRVMLDSGSWRSTSGITSISIATTSGTFQQYSQLALYGIKRAGA